MAEGEYPVPWRYCGHQVKLWRVRAGVTREQLAREANYDYETVKSMELGRRRPSERLLKVADQMCGAGGLLEAGLGYLNPDKPEALFGDYLQYEAEAVSISSFQPLVIPGLLQTEETARAIFSHANWPPISDEEVEERLATRMARQELLKHQDRAFSFVIGELPLRFPVVGAEEHKRQLQRLLDLGEQRNVTVQVLRAGGANVGLSGAFVLMEMPDHGLVSYEEGHAVASLHSNVKKTSLIAQRSALLGRLALNTEESADYIRQLMEAL
ncbi:Scr1 family TA system antitoxin-like transcriptional regulator [Streptomyces gamaensis]|uniref:Scr1 family TA system antitoxin-like transcriptional regulator n=1 Tax=Streptomyces gamaensis TaxID=1763542 RepID=A0ABW0Z1F1_9ACTN